MSKQYDWLIKTVAVVFVVAIVLHFYSLFGAGFPINQVVTQKDEVFSVTGEGRVSATPNSANISLGVASEASTALLAQEQANQAMSRVIESIKAQDIDEADIETTDYTIFPQYGLGSDETARRIIGYNVNINLRVHIRDLDKLNSVIDSATAAGSNQIGNIELVVNDEVRKNLLKQAREEAVAEAKEKAQTLASAAGVTLGRVINVAESEPATPPVPLQAEAALDITRVGAPTQIEPGTTEVVSQITIFYEIR